MEKVLDEDTHNWFNLLDELRCLGIGDDFPIPQIAVIGDQSSGKSSLLEALSGIPFPRGVGLVTRCPTCISMHKLSTNESSAKWEAEVSITRINTNKIFNDVAAAGTGKVFNPNDLAENIASLTEYLVKDSVHGFSSDIINVHIESTNVPDLTIVDLPGIIRTTTSGQSQGVIAEVNQLLDFFIRQSRTIILAVIPANQDIATIDVLERAQKADPMGCRTIGVLTKLDLVDQGGESETLSVIKNIRKPLALGYVIVKNRNQNQLKEALSLENALLEEKNYFDTHPVWKDVPVSNKGISALSKKLSKILLLRAQEAMPEMKFELQSRLEVVEKQLREFGEGQDNVTEGDKRNVLLGIISHFGQSLRQIAEGEYRDNLTQREADLRVKYHLDEMQRQLRSQLSLTRPNFDSEEYDDFLSKKVVELRGRELPGFLSARLLLSTVSVDTDPWRVDLDEGFLSAVEIFVRAASRLITSLAPQYPRLCTAIMNVVEMVCSEQSKEMLKRTDDAFDTAGLETINSDLGLIEEMNRLRFARFDATLQDVLASAGDKRMGKEALKQHVKEMMGHSYLQLHSIGYGPSLQLEDAKTALKSYWELAENRLFSHAASTIDQLLLQKGSQEIESTLLALSQTWAYGVPYMGSNSSNSADILLTSGSSSNSNNNNNDSEDGGFENHRNNIWTLAEIMEEDPERVRQRTLLSANKQKLQTGLDSITRLAPHCIARPPAK